MSLLGRRVSLNSLRVFEAAARHLSFTAAARELHSTQSAVSQQVRGLEEQLGVALFERIYRGVRLTEAGEGLFDAVQEGFATIERAIDALLNRQRHPRVNILTDFSFAAYWLMPRLPAFRRDHPQIDVRIITRQVGEMRPDPEVDVAILFCDERTLAAGVPRLFAEEVFPVCSPGFLAQHGPIDSLARLAEVPLLTLTSEDKAAWQDWPGYFQRLGGIAHRENAELIFNNYTLLIQAAIAGQGVGMGWRGLVDEAIDSGMLVGLTELALHSAQGYGLIDMQPTAAGEAKATLMAWLLEAVGAGR